MKKLILGLMLAVFLTVSAVPVVAQEKQGDNKEQKDKKKCNHHWWKHKDKKDQNKDTSK